MYVATPFPPLPTVKEMDDANDAIRVNLMMLRCLATSDLAGHYMLYETATLQDMVYVARLGLKTWENPPFPEIPMPERQGLSEEERQEYMDILDSLERYIAAVLSD